VSLSYQQFFELLAIINHLLPLTTAVSMHVQVDDYCLEARDEERERILRKCIALMPSLVGVVMLSPESNLCSH